MVYFTRPFTFHPAKGVLRPLDANCSGSTVHSSFGSKMTMSASFPRASRPFDSPRIEAGFTVIRRTISVSSIFPV